MKIRYIKSATIAVETKGIKILTDPWLVDGEYYGSWYHYPKLEIDQEYFDSVDYIYISHIHPDHFSRRTLQMLNKNIPVFIHRYESKFLKANIERLGFTVIELEHNKPYDLGKGVTINILAADNCNPELCAKFGGCAVVETKFGSTQIDSLAVIDDGEYTVLNTNDCPIDLAEEAVKNLLKRYEKIDYLLVGYAGAGPYPQCFTISEEERNAAAQRKKTQFLTQGERFIELVSPKYYMPFAGTYTLGGSLARMQNHRGVPEIEEAFEYYQKSDKIDHSKSTPILLNTYEYFDLQKDAPSKEYIPTDFDAKNKYIEEVLSKEKLEYDEDEMPKLTDILELVEKAYGRMNYKRNEIGFESETKVIVDLLDGKSAELSMKGTGYDIIDSDSPSTDRYVRYTVDPRLLNRILNGPRYAHWNNAEIGSHINFERNPNIFERGLYHSMSYFHS